MAAEDWIDVDCYDPLEDFNELEERAHEKFKGRIWVTKEGEEIPLRVMETSHIQNAIVYIERHGPDSILGLGYEWLLLLEKELIRRNKK